MGTPDPDSAAAPVVNSYQIVGKLGAGGMGVVYQAVDTRLHRTVALKFLPAQIEADEQARAQILQEARAASAMDHPNIGTIYGIEETPAGASFIVMAYYEGETLAQRLRRGPLPQAQAVAIALQIARGLAEAHAHGLIHRDIKPSNIILTRQGTVKIVDFGLARAIQSADSTASGHVAGTAAYMSPEQALGRPLDQRTDLWSLGVVLLEMLTGRLPFEADTAAAVLFAVTQRAPAHADGLAAEIQPVVYRALAKGPAERYQSAAQMAADLERIQAAAPLSSVRTETIAAAGSTMRSKRRLWWVAAAALCLVAALLALLPVRRQLAALLFGPRQKHIAVLPFTVLGGGADGQLLADGLMETLTSRLSSLEGAQASLWVVPAGMVRQRKVTDAAAAWKQFGATLVVTGTVQRSGPGVRLILNLIDSRRMAQLASEDIQEPGGDFSSLEDAAVERLAQLMNVPGPGGKAGGAVRPAAYELYLQARGLLARYDQAGNLDRAVAQLQTAVHTDPQLALAFASLGEAYLLKYKTGQDPGWLEQAAAAAQQAARIDGRLAPVYVTLGRIHVDTGKIDLGVQEFQHALQLDPRSADAMMGLSSAYESQGRLKDAEEILKRAAALRPDYWDGFTRLGAFYYRQRRYGEAVVALRRAVELTPDNAVGWANLAAALLHAGKPEEAATALATSIRINPSYGAYTNLGNLYYQQRRYADAARQYEKALSLNDKDYRTWVDLALADGWLNHPEAVQAAYRRALPLLEQEARLHPNDPVVQSSLGAAYVHLGRREEGFSRLQAALALAPRDTAVLSSLAEAYETTADRTQALLWVRKSLAAGLALEEIRNDPVLHRVLEDPRFRAR